MSEQYKCNKCGYVFDMSDMMCSECGDGYLKPLRWTKGGNGSHWDGCEEVHWDCRIAQLEKEIDRLQVELKVTQERCDRYEENMARHGLVPVAGAPESEG